MKIQLTSAINVISSKGIKEQHLMHSESGNIIFTLYNNTFEVVVELFKSFLSRYQGNLEKLLRGKDFTFDSVQLMHYKCHKVHFRCGSSYIDLPHWENKKKKQIQKIKMIKVFNIQ